MFDVKVEVFNHSGSLLMDTVLKSPSVPRIGELVTIQKSMDNTNEFIVTDVLYDIEDNTIFPRIVCESFYSKGGYSRLYFLRQGCWVEGHCGDINKDDSKVL